MADDNSYNPWNTNSTYSLIKGDSTLVLNLENEAEKKLMAEIEKTIIAKFSRLSKTNDNIIVQSKETRDTLKLKPLCLDFLEFKEKTQGEKICVKYNQVVDYINIYFTNILVKQITRKDANDFRRFLLEVPKHWKSKADLKDKDLKLLISKKSKLLDAYEKQAPQTVNEIIKRTKTIFEYFVDNLYITNNPFHNLTKLDSKNSQWREFSENELHSIFKNTDKDTEEYKFMKFALYTGLRRGELLKLKKSDINLEKGFVDVKWRNLLKECSIEFRTIYQMRHTFATIMIENNEDILWVSNMLGHTDSSMTLQMYAKYRKREDVKRASFLGNI